MRIRMIWSLLFCCLFAVVTPAYSATTPTSTSKVIPIEEFYKKIASLKVKDIQKMIGRKLSLKEKIGFVILKHKIKHPPKATSSKGQTALIFGIAGLALLVIGLFVPYVILGALVSSILAIVSGSVAKKQDPSDGKAQAGKLLGWITLGLIALLLILAAVIIASFSWGWG